MSVMSHDVINKRCAVIMGERIFAGAHLCNGISAIDNDLYVCLLVLINADHRLVYYSAYSNIQQTGTANVCYLKGGKKF